MGGCASKAKNIKATVAAAKSRRREVPSSPYKAEAQPSDVVVPAAAVEEDEKKNNGGEIQVQEPAPLVDLSEPKPNQEEAVIETRAVEEEMLVSELLDNSIVEENKVETNEPEHQEENTKAEAGHAEIVKEMQKVDEEPVRKTQGGEIVQVDDDAPPRSSVAPIVIM